ncbi:MAG: hypothetical protein LBG21_05550 [Campylobacteraceae bacterium]|jgi:hypothetical protein|nr:hypothetical protein [Campylobacteraceae bacterium]
MLKKVSIAVIAIFLLTSCGDDNKNASHSDNKDTPHNDNSSKSLKEKIEDLEDQGRLPKLDRSSSIAGPDENNNGVRDDIEAYITKNYPDEKQKKALFQAAITMQSMMLANITDPMSIKEAIIKLSRSSNCIVNVFDITKGAEGSGVYEKIEAMSVNTKARLQAYINFGKAMDGMVLVSPEGDTCE